MRTKGADVLRNGNREVNDESSEEFCFTVSMFLICTNSRIFYPPRMPSKLKYCVYVLLSEKNQKLYIGYSTDL